MEKDQFLEQLRRLQDEWGDEKYGKEKQRWLWNHLKFGDAGFLAKAIDICLSKYRFAPLPKDVVFAYDAVKQAMWQNKKKAENRESEDFDWSAHRLTGRMEELRLAWLDACKHMQGKKLKNYSFWIAEEMDKELQRKADHGENYR